MEITKKQEALKIVCADKALADKVAASVPEGIEYELVVEMLDKFAYLTAKDELEAEHMLDTKLARLYAENNFLTGHWKFLSNQITAVTLALTKKQHDLPLTSQLKKLQNDVAILGPASNFVSVAIFKHIVEKYGQGKKFVYCKTE